MSSKELIDKIAIKSLSPLKLTDAERREIIAALEAADRDVLHWKMKHDRKCEEIAALKAQVDCIMQWATTDEAEETSGDWHRGYDAARSWVLEVGWCAMPKAAPQAAAYAEKNPLGGPARMFDAIADRIRAGEPMTEVLEDFNLKFEQQATGETP